MSTETKPPLKADAFGGGLCLVRGRGFRDLGEGAGEDSLEGRYFPILQPAAQNATGPEAEALCLAARISRRILEGQEVTLP